MSTNSDPTRQGARRPSSPRGVSLVEILMALILITVVALATLSYFSHGMAGVHTQGNRRAALERARERMEEVLAASKTQVAPPVAINPTRGDAWYWVSCTAGVCTWSAADPNQTVAVADLNAQPMECLIRWVDDASLVASPAPDSLEVSVKVWFAPGAADTELQRVHLRSLRAP